MKIIKRILLVLVLLVVAFFVFIKTVDFAIDKGYTNAESMEIVYEKYDTKIPASNWQVHKYINENPQNKDSVENSYYYLNGTGENPNWFPQNNGGLDFVVEGMYNRKEFVSSVKTYSDHLGIDKDLVMACVMGEQVRIANKGARGKLKNIVVNGTPTMFRSYDVSLGIGGIKLSTANQIRRDANKYGYGEYLSGDAITQSGLILNDKLNAKYATFLVKNILTRRDEAGHPIDKKPGVVCTLYNMGNDYEKEPHEDPKVGGTVININGKDYVYGGISEAVYRYLKIYSQL